jgi:phage terminase large subunit-like protein
VIDEVGFMPVASWDALLLASGKRPWSLVVGIGTPGVDHDNALWHLRQRVLDDVELPGFRWTEYAAPEGCDVHDETHWPIANPALTAGFMNIDALRTAVALSPEAHFRIFRLGQWADTLNTWLPDGAWAACADPTRRIEDGAEVVLGFDGSYNGDSTAIVAVTVEDCPHVAVVEAWERPQDAAEAAEWKVPVVDVEQKLRDGCRRFWVREIVADPYRWARSLQILEAEGLPVVEHPQTPSRMTPATQSLYEAVVNGTVTHSGDQRLARHIGNATVRVDARGTRLTKDSKHSTRKIDLALAAVMAHARAVALNTMPALQIY